LREIECNGSALQCDSERGLANDFHLGRLADFHPTLSKAEHAAAVFRRPDPIAFKYRGVVHKLPAGPFHAAEHNDVSGNRGFGVSLRRREYQEKNTKDDIV